MKEKIIINGFDVSECPHINAYFPDSPKCQQGMGVGGCGSDCNGDCRYTEKLKVEQIKLENKKLKKLLKKIDKKLELALDTEQTDAEESINLLYEIQDIITEIGE